MMEKLVKLLSSPDNSIKNNLQKFTDGQKLLTLVSFLWSRFSFF